MTQAIRLILILITVLLTSFTSLFSKENSVTDHFRLRSDIRDETTLTKDIGIFFKNTPNYYNLPDRPRSKNVLTLYDVNDPLEAYNRTMFVFNTELNRCVLRPISEIFSCVFPEYVRKGFARMADNIQLPNRFLNTILQGRIERTGIEVARFCVNTTIGIAGFYDPAQSWMGLEQQSNSFGRSFEYWGIGPGCYVILPIQGSTTLRDGLGLILDWYSDPLTWIPPDPLAMFSPIRLGIKAFLKVNDMTLLMEDYVRIYDSSKDPYQTFKLIYTMFNHMEMMKILNDKSKFDDYDYQDKKLILYDPGGAI
ncbi:MAG TPA: VacJ family lipoprotein [Victivallales bacterium]|nr:VacJ family lipoprotein [Victivallales bacterium]